MFCDFAWLSHDPFSSPVFKTVLVQQNPWLETKIMSLGGGKQNVNVCHLRAESEAAYIET